MREITILKNKTRVFIKQKALQSGIIGSWIIEDLEIINKYKNNRDHHILISFPRTGSHWLRLLMELYFQKPSLKRIFYYYSEDDFLSLHDHDLDLATSGDNIIYIYRDLVDTIFSQLYYHNISLDDEFKIVYWSSLYGKHLDKWLCKEAFSKNKTVISYERLEKNISKEFSKVVNHFTFPFDENRFLEISKKIDKKEVKRKTRHDQRIIHSDRYYQKKRIIFRSNYSPIVWNVILRNREYLKDYFYEDAL
jgi:hypothetical protein